MSWKDDDESMKIMDQLSKDLRHAFGELAKGVSEIGQDYAAEIRNKIGEPLRAEIHKRIVNEDGTLNPYAKVVADHPRLIATPIGIAKGGFLGAAFGPVGAKVGAAILGTTAYFTGPDIVKSIIEGAEKPGNDAPTPPPPVAPAAEEKPEKPRRKPQAFKLD